MCQTWAYILWVLELEVIFRDYRLLLIGTLSVLHLSLCQENWVDVKDIFGEPQVEKWLLNKCFFVCFLSEDYRDDLMPLKEIHHIRKTMQTCTRTTESMFENSSAGPSTMKKVKLCTVSESESSQRTSSLFSDGSINRCSC